MQNWLPNVDGLPSPKESLNLGNLFDSVSAAHNAIRKSAALVKSASTDAVSRVPSSSVLYEGAKELVTGPTVAVVGKMADAGLATQNAIDSGVGAMRPRLNDSLELIRQSTKNLLSLDSTYLAARERVEKRAATLSLQAAGRRVMARNVAAKLRAKNAAAATAVQAVARRKGATAEVEKRRTAKREAAEKASREAMAEFHARRSGSRRKVNPPRSLDIGETPSQDMMMADDEYDSTPPGSPPSKDETSSPSSVMHLRDLPKQYIKEPEQAGPKRWQVGALLLLMIVPLSMLLYIASTTGQVDSALDAPPVKKSVGKMVMKTGMQLAFWPIAATLFRLAAKAALTPAAPVLTVAATAAPPIGKLLALASGTVLAILKTAKPVAQVATAAGPLAAARLAVQQIVINRQGGLVGGAVGTAFAFLM